MKNEKHFIGEQMTVDYYLKRSFFKEKRNWIPTPMEKCTVFVVGIRTLQNGDVKYNGINGEGEMPEFKPTVHFKALMVTKSIYSKPFFIIDTPVVIS